MPTVIYSYDEVIAMLDYTLVRPDAGQEDLAALCADASDNGFKAVCVNPVNVKNCRKFLKNSAVKVCAAIGFPLGATFTDVKVRETKRAVKDGADEIDAVINIAAAKSGSFDAVRNELCKIVRAAKGRIVKAIIEISCLNDDQISSACRAAVSAGARFVQTSTGYSGEGADVRRVTLMRDVIEAELKKDNLEDMHRCGVKAAGGISSFEQAKALADAGAARIGTTHAREIVNGKTEVSGQ